MIVNSIVNLIDGLIISPTLTKRPRSVIYESDIIISFVTSYDFEFNFDTSRDSTSSDFENFTSRKRQKRKSNFETLTYYYRCLNHANDVKQLSHYEIDLSKDVSDKTSCVFCIIKKIQQVKYISHIRSNRRSLDLIYSDINIIKEIKDGFRYFITFLDDFTKRFEVELLRFKDEAFSIFRRFLIRNKRDKFRYRRLRTNWGDEYSDHVFNRFRDKNNILWELIMLDNF